MMTHSGKLRNMSSVYIRSGNKLLLLYRQGNSIVQNLWIGSAGGHFEAAEYTDARACLLRELKEELDLEESSLTDLSLRYITLRYTNGELRQNYYFFARLSDNVVNTFSSTEGILQWFDLADVKLLDMPVTAAHVISHYIDCGQFDQELYGAIVEQTDCKFVKL